ncbi:MAG TPA: hypothetical protein PKA64_24425, partial [Myxococcota bacterium]|nr:hypothetical protein [Myxococcota bacterium]
ARVVFTRAPDAATLAAWRAACGPDAPFVILADEAEGPEVALPEAPERVRTERQLARLRGASPDPVPEAWLAAARALADSDDGLVLLAHGLAALDRALRQDEPGPPAPRTPEETRRKRKRKRRKATRPDERPGDDGDDDATDEITAPG